MSNNIISIFGTKIFLEILKEIKFLSKFQFKNYENLKLCLKESESKDEKKIVVLFINKNNKKLFADVKKIRFPLLLLHSPGIDINISSDALDTLEVPFKIWEFDKKITSLISRNEYLKNSFIKLGDYVIDKNERKIKKNNIDLKLSEKEINFLILFSQQKEPIKKNLVLEKAWKYSSESETHTVETHIHRLRKKILEKFNDNSFIKNNNKGYYI